MAWSHSAVKVAAVPCYQSGGLSFAGEKEPPVPFAKCNREGEQGRHSCALYQCCAFLSLLLVWLFPYHSPMILLEEPYHSFVEKQPYINQGS